MSYELAIDIFENKLVWIKGPFKAGTNDISIFRKLLIHMIPKGKKLIGDSGYRGEPEIIATASTYNSASLKNFKKRARARHEDFNGQIKKFAILSTTFRHNLKLHKTVFTAVSVLVQYDVENGNVLMDI